MIARGTSQMDSNQNLAAGRLGDAIRAIAGDLAIGVSFARRLERNSMYIEVDEADWIVFIIVSALPYLDRCPRSERRRAE